MKTKFLLFALLLSCGFLAAQHYADDPYAVEMGWYADDDDTGHRGRRPRLQAALILDASGSMDGLIEQAKAQLWYMANGMLEAYEGQRPPVLEFALLEYGKDALGQRRDFMRVIVPFTTDLDWISEELFRMRTNGRYEYPGAAIDLALQELDWTQHPDDLRMLYLAGNERINQGPVPMHQALRWAQEQDVYTQLIFCGPHRNGIQLGWSEAARQAGTEYLSISHDRPVYYEHNTWDDRLLSYNDRLNATYIPYGTQGYSRYERMRNQDRNANRYGEGPAAQRVITKASAGYAHTDWDLVDAVSSGTVRLAELPSHHLPREMRSMSLRQKEAYINRKRNERMGLRQEIRVMRQQQKQRAPRAHDRPTHQHTGAPAAQSAEPRTLDQAVIKATRKQELKKHRPTVNKVRTPQSVSDKGSPRPAIRPVRTPQAPRPSAVRPAQPATTRPTRTPATAAPSAVRSAPAPQVSHPAPARSSVEAVAPVSTRQMKGRPAAAAIPQPDAVKATVSPTSRPATTRPQIRPKRVPRSTPVRR